MAIIHIMLFDLGISWGADVAAWADSREYPPLDIKMPRPNGRGIFSIFAAYRLKIRVAMAK